MADGAVRFISENADLLIQPCDEQLAAMLHEAVGEGSLFAQRTGYNADILRPEIVETLSPGWEERLVKLGETDVVAALSPEDLLVVKLRSGRTKDLELCRVAQRRADRLPDHSSQESRRGAGGRGG